MTLPPLLMMHNFNSVATVFVHFDKIDVGNLLKILAVRRVRTHSMFTYCRVLCHSLSFIFISIYLISHLDMITRGDAAYCGCGGHIFGVCVFVLASSDVNV